MCLRTNNTLTDKILKKKGYIIGYKVLLWRDESKGLFSQYFPFKWKIGWNISDYKDGVIVTYAVKEGIHVFLDRNAAIYHTKGYCDSMNCRIVPVKCYVKHLIKAGSFRAVKSAAFSKVFLSKTAYNKALNVPKKKELVK